MNSTEKNPREQLAILLRCASAGGKVDFSDLIACAKGVVEENLLIGLACIDERDPLLPQATIDASRELVVRALCNQAQSLVLLFDVALSVLQERPVRPEVKHAIGMMVG